MTAPTWTECHAAGMTAREAGVATGLSESAARAWSSRNAVRWARAPHGPSKPITLGGVDYPSRSAAARAHGVTLAGLNNAIARGGLDRLGQGKQGPGLKWEDCYAAGMTLAEAAAARGRTRVSGAGWAARRGLKWPDMLHVPVTIRGVAYPSIQAAADALGVKANTISTLLARHGHAETAGLGRQAPRGPNPGNSKPIRLGSVEYPSRKAAAVDLGIAEDRFCRGLKGVDRAAQQEIARRLMAREAQTVRANMRLAEMVDGVRSGPRRVA